MIAVIIHLCLTCFSDSVIFTLSCPEFRLASVANSYSKFLTVIERDVMFCSKCCGIVGQVTWCVCLQYWQSCGKCRNESVWLRQNLLGEAISQRLRRRRQNSHCQRLSRQLIVSLSSQTDLRVLVRIHCTVHGSHQLLVGSTVSVWVPQSQVSERTHIPLYHHLLGPVAPTSVKSSVN